MRNYGQHNALLCGIRAARYDVVVTMDDDLQHPPEEIPQLLAKLAEGYDVVYGAPRERPHGLLRNLASHDDQAGAAGRDGRARPRDGQRVPRVSHGAARRLRARSAVRSSPSTCC